MYYEGQEEARDLRREAARNRAVRIRNEAIMALGGKCCKCQIEDDPRDLKIEVLSEGKKWSQIVFYRRVAEYPNRDKLARLICNKCRFNEYQEARLLAKVKEPKPEGTGEFYWVAGVRVEQKRKRTGVGANGELIVHPTYDDGQFSSKE